MEQPLFRFVTSSLLMKVACISYFGGFLSLTIFFLHSKAATKGSYLRPLISPSRPGGKLFF